MRLRTILSLLLVLDTAAALAEDGESIVIHPFKAQNALNLSGSDLNLKETTESVLRTHGINPGLKLKSQGSKGLNLVGNSTVESEDFAYEVDGYPLCDFQIKIHRTADGSTMMFGQLPHASGSLSAQESDWASLAVVSERARLAQENAGFGSVSKVAASKRCLLVEGGALKAVWQLDVQSKGLLYAITADAEKIYANDPKFFDAKGQTQVFSSNLPKAPLTKLDLNDLSEGPFLVNPYFETCLSKSADVVVCPSFPGTEQEAFARATAASSFIFSPETQRNEFVQASVFTNVNKALTWAKEQGYQNFGQERIRVVAHATFSNSVRDDDPNNALYLPSTPPQIQIGDGDGNTLQNLGVDEDVVSHEFGHHIVYATVKNIRGEALVLHEGLADFFTFARTGNACLGETICPDTLDGEYSCYKPRACLRTGENDLKWGAENLPKQAHLRGQLVSGFMWDLYKKDSIALKDVTNLSFKAVDYLIADSGYKHWILALMLADKANYNGVNCEKILARAKARGFDEFLADTSCQSIAEISESADVKSVKNVPNAGTGSAPRAVVATSTKQKKKGCGVLSASASAGQTPGFLVLWSIPLMLAWFRRFRS